MFSPSPGHPPQILTAGDDSKPGIVFLHGFLGSGRDWLPVADMLGDRFHCLMPDLPGHGEHPPPFDPGPEAFHNAAIGLLYGIEPLHAGPLHVVGYSMGGRMALYLALRFSEWFTTATIVSASPGLRTAEERESRRVHDESLAADVERDFDAFLESWYSLPLFSTLKSSPAFAEVFAARRSGDPMALADSLRAFGTGNQPQLWDELAGNRLPIMFCAGEKDAKFVEIAGQMVNLCPGSALEIFPGCGHTLQVEERLRFVERLTFFINKHQHS